MNDTDRILLNQATLLRCMWAIMTVIAHDRGTSDSPVHKEMMKKLIDSSKETEEYALRNWRPN